MRFPYLVSGIEEKTEFACFGIEGAKVGAFIAIAAPASVGQVLQTGCATMFNGNDMVDFMGVKANVGGKLAVFTSLLGTIDDLLAEGFGNVGHDR